MVAIKSLGVFLIVNAILFFNIVCGDDLDLNYMLSLVNSARSDNGVDPPLQLNSLLIGTAQRHSERMEESGELSHDDEDGDFATRITNSGSGYENEDSSMNGWMNSPPHRANILNPDFRDLGVGRSGDYWTQDLG
ncbi:hypothetical protein C2G38_2035395 [Gigaspora rosea]|uniref:SCP domain-containing protein n=1 Tax=Gigaspora rosea TaxID=44941 RepID=A0A397VCV1_9GLOM|nr:hypothetical protein C2G38_2035395 [Gigaspora rosea]